MISYGGTHMDPDLHEPQYVRQLLENFRKTSGASAVALFSVNPVSFEVRIEALAGEPAQLPPYLKKLAHSPVGDVAIRKEVIQIGDIEDTTAPKHRWLLKAIPYKSCIACPVAAPTALTRHALFAFHPERNAFDAAKRDLFSAIGLRIEASLHFGTVLFYLTEVQPILVAGELATILAHELNSTLSGMSMDLTRLFDECRQANIGRSVIPRVTRDFEHARETLLFFSRRSSRSQTDGWATLATCIRHVVSLARHRAADLGVGVDVDLSEETRNLKIRTPEWQTILWNLIHNALDAIPLAGRGSREGRILVLGSCGPKSLKIVVEDNGPGMESEVIGRIFEPGFTTKPNRAGFGLFMAKQLVQSLGGALTVESQWGVFARFTVQMPFGQGVRNDENTTLD